MVDRPRSGAFPPLPTFVIIGAQKSATRWLRSNLGAHPDVYALPFEASFFNIGPTFLRGGLLWYRSQFDGWQGEPIVGEATPGYMMPRHKPVMVAKRIRAVLPDARLIAMLRNPIDRAESAMLHHVRRGRLPADVRLIDLVRHAPSDVERLGIVNGGLYAASLEPYLRRFGDQLLVLLYDDLLTDAEGLYRTALRHIGADDRFVPDDLHAVRYSNRRVRTGRGRRRDSRPQLAASAITPAEREEIFELFRDDVDELEVLLGRTLPWRPSVRAGR